MEAKDGSSVHARGPDHGQDTMRAPTCGPELGQDRCSMQMRGQWMAQRKIDVHAWRPTMRVGQDRRPRVEADDGTAQDRWPQVEADHGVTQT